MAHGIHNTNTTSSRYLQLLDTWNAQNRGTIDQKISRVFMEVIPKDSKAIKVERHCLCNT